MNKKQGYASGFILLMGIVLCAVSTVRFGAMPLDDLTFAVWSGVHLLLGKVCLLGAVICFICGWLEKADAQ